MGKIKEKHKEEIFKDTESIFNKITFSGKKEFNLKDIINIFTGIVEFKNMENIEDALRKRFDGKIENQLSALDNLAGSVEDYFSFVYNDVMNLNLGVCVASAYFKQYFKDQAKSFSYDDKYLFWTDKETLRQKKQPGYFSNKFEFGEYFKYSYDLRNAFSHASKIITYPTFSINLNKNDSLNVYFRYLLVFYIFLTFKYKNNIIRYLLWKKCPDFTNYLFGQVKKFENKISRFIHIRGNENSTLHNNRVIEEVNYEESDEDNFENSTDNIPRSGIINELRKTVIPEKRMLLWGNAGIGKTTTLEFLTYVDAKDKLINSNENVPVYLSLGILTDINKSIKTSIFEKLNIDEVLGEELLKNGMLNIFIDALNEISEENKGLKTKRNIEIQEFINNYPNTFFVLANRRQEINEFTDIPVFEIQKLNDAELDEYIYKNATKYVQGIVKSKLKELPNLSGNIRIPLYLNILLYLLHEKKEFPENIGDLVDQFIQSIFKREKIEKKDEKFDIKKINKLLRSLGFESKKLKNANAGMKHDEVVSILANCSEKYNMKIDIYYVIKISTELGILEETENIYTFAHESYQDYFYALEENSKLLI